MQVLAELRDDLYEHHQKTGQQIQFPLVRNCCCYAFAKGAEAAWLWHQSSNGKVKLRHSSREGLKGAAGAKVPGEYAAAVTAGMQLSAEVFCDFQNRVLLDESLDFAQGGRWLADGFACAFFWFGQVGLDFGMKRLGYP